MSKYKVKKKKSKYGEYVKAKKELKESVTGNGARRIGILFLSSLFFLSAYIAAWRLQSTKYYMFALGIIIACYCALSLLVIAYIIMNRGILGDIPTPGQLSDDMSESEKNEFIEKIKKNKKRSRPLIYLILPLMVIVGFDIIYTIFISK